MWDTDTVEIARGSQLTSTGRNGFVGAVRVYSNRPAFDFEAQAQTRNRNQGSNFAGALMVNAPLLQDEFAARFTAETSFGSSYIDAVNPPLVGFDVDLFAAFFGIPVISTAVFEPEFIDQRELSLQTTVLEGQLDLGATAFYYVWKDA